MTLLLSAALLFGIQPMFAKLLLPRLGAAPAVWNVCAAFYQTVLLVGYLYAHGLVRRLPPRGQALVHVGLALAAIAALPPNVVDSGVGSGQPGLPWLLGQLLVVLGAPLFVLSATAPLLQAWFARSTAAGARDPYFLYAASNLGSLVGVVSYPLVIEPRLPLAVQARLWTGGYCAVLVLVAMSAARFFRPAPDDGSPLPPAVGPARFDLGPVLAPAWRDRFRWVLLSSVPAALSLAVTGHLTTDLAAIPLLWALPLALYLLTFVIAFARRQTLLPAFIQRTQRIQPILLLPAAFALAFRRAAPPWLMVLDLANLFVTALVCHHGLAARRPAPRHLTEFYVWVGLGGILGGLFTAWAPWLFSAVAEYPLVLVLAAFCRRSVDPDTPSSHPQRWLDVALPIVLAAALFAAIRSILPEAIEDRMSMDRGLPGAVLLFGALAAATIVCFSFVGRPWRFSLGYAAVAGAAFVIGAPHRAIHVERTFFGVHQVRRSGDLRILSHGTTDHGAQSTRDPEEPLGYYGRTSPIGQALAARRPSAVAVVGLGAGTLAAYGSAGQRWTFYEIDPAVVGIARDPRLFTFLRDSRAAIQVVIGDARLTLARAAASYDVFVLDAFSSDAIPAHLLTKEAFALYLTRLARGGIIALHVSNRFLDVRRVVAAVARDLRLAGLYQMHEGAPPEDPLAEGKFPSEWVVLARSAEDLRALMRDGRWTLVPDPATRAWTDDFSHVLGALRWSGR